MTVAYWTPKAEELAARVAEQAPRPAVITAAAWKAGVAPEATRGLVSAAMALGAPLSMLYAADIPPLDNDKMMVAHAEDLTADVADLFTEARRLRNEAHSEMQRIYESLTTTAQRRLDTARSDPQSKDAAAADLRELLARITDCENAAELLADVAARLEYALAGLEAVPDHLEETYEAPYRFVRAGGKLPHAGAWLSAGKTPTEGAA